MKNIIKILLTAVLSLALLAGCTGKKQPKSPEQIVSENVTVTVEEARKNIESLINLSNYNAVEKEDGTVYYAFKSVLFNDYDLRYIVSLGAETKINLPENFTVMKKLKWEASNPNYNNLMLKPGASTNVVCEREGKEIMVYLNNFTDEEIRCTDGVVSRIKFDLYSKEDGYKEILKTAPEFKIGNSIDNNSDINDLISAIGEPSNISYSVDGEKCSDITLLYQNASNRDWLKFILSADGEKIVSIDYYVEK